MALGSIRLLATQAKAWNAPVMGCYLFTPATDTGRAAFSSLAIMLKNFIRPLGLWRLGLPCLLNGSGSAYPFSLLRNAPHGEGFIAEDYQLTVDLLEQGYPTRFVPTARIVGQFPHKDATAQKQRRRWEHGHLHLSLHVAPRLLLNGISLFDKNRLAIGLDLLVPPLVYLALIGGVVATLAFGKAALGQVWPLQVMSVSVVLFVVSLILAWGRYAELAVTLQTLAELPRYVLWKLPIYRDYFRQRETRWMKTERD
ncbi:glycosyltransferase [Methylotuvimicrobium sp. KM1]|uniref:glycosyltransferase family 2 protein n=1 Tax=Methylotuvimicrobium sp. KM1 TaxID=3377707 RepID=UPI003850902C